MQKTVALNKFSVFVGSTPKDNTPIKLAMGALFAFATGVQDSPLEEPDYFECQR